MAGTWTLSEIGQADSPFFGAGNTIASWPPTSLQQSLQGQHHTRKVELALLQVEALHVGALQVEVLPVVVLPVVVAAFAHHEELPEPAQEEGGALEQDEAQEQDEALARGLGYEQEAVAWDNHGAHAHNTMHACQHPTSSQDTGNCP